MTRRLAQILFIAFAVLAATGAVAAVCLYFFGGRLEVADVFVYGTSTVLLGFLGLLVLRCLLLTTISLVENIRHAAEPAIAADYPSFSVIVPACNEGPVIESSIAAAMSLNYPNFEVIVVDDGSTDDTYEKAAALSSRYGAHRLRVFRKANSGKGSALNAGIRYARGELILCTDADSRLDRDVLRRAASHFADPSISAVAGNVKVANRLNTLTRLQALEYIQGLNLVRMAQSAFRKVTVIPGPVGMFRKSVLDAVGGYATNTFAEDCDITLQIMLHGGRIKYDMDVIAWTEAPETASTLIRQRYRWSRGIMQAILKHKRWLSRPFSGFGTWLSLWLFVIESIAIPMMNLAGLAFFLFTTLSGGGMSSLVVLWWAQLTVIDAAIAAYCLAAEGEDLRLMLQVVVFRVFFVPFVDVVRALAWVDELFSVPMSWLRQERVGRI
jgi:biofilm PGA synthesis N-glycosyltransferase PgaC